MDGSSPEHTMIARSLKDLSRFITSSQRGGNTATPWDSAKSPCMQLSFSEGRRGNMTTEMETVEEREESRVGSTKRKAETSSNQSLKRHRDSVTGLDVCRILRDKEVEMVDSRATITQLKAQLSSATASHAKLKLDYDSELSNHRLNNLKYKEMVEDLKLKIKNERSVSEAVRRELSRVREESSKLKSSSQYRVTSTITDYTSLNEDLSLELTALREELENTEKKLGDTTSELDLYEAETKGLRGEVKNYVQKVKDLRESLTEVDTLKLQLQSAHANIKELEGRLLNLSSQEHLMSSFEASVQKLPELERQLTKLKEENDMYRACSANTRLLEEKVASATDQIELLKQRCDNTTQLDTQLQHLQSQFIEFEEIVKSELSLTSSPKPEELRSLLKGLRSNDQSLTDSITAMRDSMGSHERQYAAQEKECDGLRDSTAQQLQLSQRHVQLARRLQRKLLLVSKERDTLKGIIATYEAETTMTAAIANNSGRVNSLESSLVHYKQELAKMEQELDYYQHAPLLHGDKALMNKSERAELFSTQERVKALEEQVSKLQEEKEVLEYRLEQRAMRGDYDPSQVNVLHMVQNPVSEAEEQFQDKVAKLEEEVKSLKEQLSSALNSAAVEATVNASVAAAAAAAANLTNTSEEDKQRIQELEKEIKSADVKTQRLVDAFKSKRQEVLELVYRLLGYKITTTGESCYKFANMYAESPNDFFTFEFASNGEIRLLETEFSNSLEDLIDEYLNNESSYPAFLSSVTIELFSKQTMIADPSARPSSSSYPHVQGRAVAAPEAPADGGQPLSEESAGAQQQHAGTDHGQLQQRRAPAASEDDDDAEEDAHDGEHNGAGGAEDDHDDDDDDDDGGAEDDRDDDDEDDEDMDSDEDEDRDDNEMDDDDDNGDDDDEEDDDEQQQHANHQAANNDDDDDDLICLD